jgi:hypothetical protein
MAVYTNTFGGLQLTGDDAKKFRNQVRHGRTSEAARQTASRGRGMAASISRGEQIKVDIT